MVLLDRVLEWMKDTYYYDIFLKQQLGDKLSNKREIGGERGRDSGPWIFKDWWILSAETNQG